MVDWSWIISQITFCTLPIQSSHNDGGGQGHGQVGDARGDQEEHDQAHRASTEMQSVPSLAEEKYLGEVTIWLRRPTDIALNGLVISDTSFTCVHRVVGFDRSWYGTGAPILQVVVGGFHRS